MLPSPKHIYFEHLVTLAVLFQLSSGYAGRAIPAASSSTVETAEVSVRLVMPAHGNSTKQARLSSVVWLVSVHGDLHLPATVPGVYTLLQRNKRFSPHLLVVPVGSLVHFPNQDPFFHNVFSLFNGRRFDLGLYEAGSSRDVTFSRAGVSYIFCNIHPEMSAVVLALATPLYSTADAVGPQTLLHIHDVPQGTYALHVWIEGENEHALDALTHTVQVSAGHADLGAITLPAPTQAQAPHSNKFNQPYDTSHPAIY